MAISESQLEIWSHQGSKTQSATTYEKIRKVLEDPTSPFSNREFDIFLQGSYANDTNIYADSDVDIIICLTSTFYSDLDQLSATEKALYESERIPGSYSFAEFKLEVAGWLASKFGTGVKSGNKAIFVPGDGVRRDADVLACAEIRRFTSYTTSSKQYHSGIVFWTNNNTKIVNFPKQHCKNCTKKHQDSSNRFKPNVRVLKNIRNGMIKDRVIREGVAPSYFVEGMLWNVPSNNFTSTYQQSFQNCINWLKQCDPDKLSCANDLQWLIRNGVPVCWNRQDFQTFLTALQVYWDS